MNCIRRVLILLCLGAFVSLGEEELSIFTSTNGFAFAEWGYSNTNQVQLAASLSHVTNVSVAGYVVVPGSIEVDESQMGTACSCRMLSVPGTNGFNVTVAVFRDIVDARKMLLRRVAVTPSLLPARLRTPGDLDVGYRCYSIWKTNSDDRIRFTRGNVYAEVDSYSPDISAVALAAAIDAAILAASTNAPAAR